MKQIKFLLFFTVMISFQGCNYLQDRVDISKYHIQNVNKEQYLSNQKDIVVYNSFEHTLEKISFFKDDKVLYSISYLIYPIYSEYIFGMEGNMYYHRLSQISCDMFKIEECIKQNINSSNGYIINNDTKSYILDQEFGLELFDTIDDYKNYLLRRENIIEFKRK